MHLGVMEKILYRVERDLDISLATLYFRMVFRAIFDTSQDCYKSYPSADCNIQSMFSYVKVS